MVLTPAPYLWTLWLRVTWLLADRSGFIKRPLLALGFIHIAHWGLVSRLPQRASRGHRRPLPSRYIVFQSNFDGPPEEYAEAFAIKVPGRIRGLWGGARDFPGPHPRDHVRPLRARPPGEGPVPLLRRLSRRRACARSSRRSTCASPTRRSVRRAARLEPDELLAAWRAVPDRGAGEPVKARVKRPASHASLLGVDNAKALAERLAAYDGAVSPFAALDTVHFARLQMIGGLTSKARRRAA